MAGVDMDLVRQKQAEVEARTNNDSWFSFDDDGVYQLRILPPFGEKTQFWLEYQKAFRVGPNQKIVVPLAQYGLECPLQKRIDALNHAGDELSKKEAGKMRPKSRAAMIVIDRKNEARGPLVFETNLDVFRDILTIMADPDFGDITRPSEGIDISISYTKKGKTGFPEYIVQPKRNSTPLSANEQQQIIWLSKDWFEEYRVGKPSEAGYIQAVLDGTDAAYVEARRGQQQQQQQTAPQTQAPVSAPTAPPSLVAPPAQPAVPVVTHQFLAGTKLWQALNGAVSETTVEDVCKRLKTEKPGDVMLMRHDQSGGWLSASALGFQVTIPAPPAAPAAPPPPTSPPTAPPSMPAMPPPPGGASNVPFNTPPSEEASLAAQLAGLSAPQGPQSQVARDIMQALGK